MLSGAPYTITSSISLISIPYIQVNVNTFLYTETGPVYAMHAYHSKSNCRYQTSEVSGSLEHALYVFFCSLCKAGMVEAYCCCTML